MFVTTCSNSEEQNDLNYQEGLGFQMCSHLKHLFLAQLFQSVQRYVLVNLNVNSSAEQAEYLQICSNLHCLHFLHHVGLTPCKHLQSRCLYARLWEVDETFSVVWDVLDLHSVIFQKAFRNSFLSLILGIQHEINLACIIFSDTLSQAVAQKII